MLLWYIINENGVLAEYNYDVDNPLIKVTHLYNLTIGILNGIIVLGGHCVYYLGYRQF